MTNTGIDFEVRNHCPICASRHVRLLIDNAFSDASLYHYLQTTYSNRADLSALGKGRYQIAQCHKCDFVFQRQIFNDAGMNALYNDWIDSEKSLAKKRSAKAQLFARYSRIVQMIAHFHPKPPNEVKVLDFGMGWGYWARVAQAF
ncbi:MAG: hypothetical protein AAF420_10205, partial [Pseudomonadota bacterium]